jgi:hypothetical protein
MHHVASLALLEAGRIRSQHEYRPLRAEADEPDAAVHVNSLAQSGVATGPPRDSEAGWAIRCARLIDWSLLEPVYGRTRHPFREMIRAGRMG